MRKFFILSLMAFVMCSCASLYYTPAPTQPVQQQIGDIMVSFETIDTHSKSYADIVVMVNKDTLYICNNAIIEHSISTTTYNLDDSGQTHNINVTTTEVFNGGLKLGGTYQYMDNNGNYNLISSGVTYFVNNIVKVTEPSITNSVSLMTDTKKSLIKQKQESLKQKQLIEEENTKKNEKINKLKRDYENANKQIELNKVEMKKLPKNSEEYQIKKSQNEQMKRIAKGKANEYYSITGIYLN